MRGRLKIAHNGPVTASRRLPALLRWVVAAVLLTAAAVTAVSHPVRTAADGLNVGRRR